MSDPDSGIRDVHVLTTRTRGSVGVNTKVLFIDLDIGDILEEWSDLEGCKGCLTFPLSVEWRNADEPMYAVLRPEPPIGMTTVH
jgi:hypothetical protein